MYLLQVNHINIFPILCTGNHHRLKNHREIYYVGHNIFHDDFLAIVSALFLNE